MTALTFDEFQATGRPVPDLSTKGVKDELGPGRIYEGGCYIEERPPEGWPNGSPERWYLILANEDWLSDDLEALEHRLYSYYLAEASS